MSNKTITLNNRRLQGVHPTIRKLWERKLTLAKWAKANGFLAPYCSMVIHGKRGTRGFGKSEDIINALKAGGFWVEPENKDKEVTK